MGGRVQWWANSPALGGGGGGWFPKKKGVGWFRMPPPPFQGNGRPWHCLGGGYCLSNGFYAMGRDPNLGVRVRVFRSRRLLACWEPKPTLGSHWASRTGLNPTHMHFLLRLCFTKGSIASDAHFGLLGHGLLVLLHCNEGFFPGHQGISYAGRDPPLPRGEVQPAPFFQLAPFSIRLAGDPLGGSLRNSLPCILISCQ